MVNIEMSPSMAGSFSIAVNGLISTPSDSVPRVCFIGFCDVVQPVKGSLAQLSHLNLGGVSSARIFLMYPIHIQGQAALFAIYEPASGEKLLIHCRPASGNGQDFFLPIEVSFQEVDGNGPAVPQDGQSTASRIPGWVLLPAQIGGEVLVTEPGEYRAYLAQGEGELYLGSMFFLHAQAPPITPEEATALAATPLARKDVQFTLSCKKCGSDLRIYAGLQKNAELESVGWCRNDELPERFHCQCSAMDLDLQWIKSGLHAALRPSVEPYIDPAVHVIRMYEQGELEEAVNRFNALLNADSPVRVIRQFLETNSTLFSIFNPVMLRTMRLADSCNFDFAIVNNSRELLLIKLESASPALVQRDRVPSPALKSSFEQAAASLNEIGSGPAGLIGLPLEQIMSTKAVVLAGRTPKSEIKIHRKAEFPGVELYTYDDMVRYLAEVVRGMPGLALPSSSSLASVQPGCYAGSLADCAGGLSREHYFSDAILRLFGDVDMKVSGMPWQKEGEQKILRAASLVSNVLCQKHNQRLSPLDKEAEDFFNTIYKCTRGGIQGLIPIDDLHFEFNGRLLERWMLKVICGAIAAGNYRGNSRVVPSSWVDVLYERRPWPEEFTFYLIDEKHYTVPDYDHVGLDFVGPDEAGGLVKGLTCHFMAVSITLALGKYTGVPGIPRTKTKMQLGMKNDERTILTTLKWPDNE
jgi:hypothetical protein